MGKYNDIFIEIMKPAQKTEGAAEEGCRYLIPTGRIARPNHLTRQNFPVYCHRHKPQENPQFLKRSFSRNVKLKMTVGKSQLFH